MISAATKSAIRRRRASVYGGSAKSIPVLRRWVTLTTLFHHPGESRDPGP